MTYIYETSQGTGSAFSVILLSSSSAAIKESDFSVAACYVSMVMKNQLSEGYMTAHGPLGSAWWVSQPFNSESGWSISVRVRFLPFPRLGEALAKISVLGCPVEVPVDFRWITVYLGIISGSTGKIFNLDGSSCCLHTSFHKLIHWSTW